MIRDYRCERPKTGGAARRGEAGGRALSWAGGRRLGHILDPRTGWPIEGAPRAVTVLAPTCVEAGTLSTLAYLQGPSPARFLADQGVQYRIA